MDVGTGRAFTHPIVDFELAGPLPLRFERSASSTAAEHDTGLGTSWSPTFGWQNRGAASRDAGVLQREAWGYQLDVDNHRKLPSGQPHLIHFAPRIMTVGTVIVDSSLEHVSLARFDLENEEDTPPRTSLYYVDTLFRRHASLSAPLRSRRLVSMIRAVTGYHPRRVLLATTVGEDADVTALEEVCRGVGAGLVRASERVRAGLASMAPRGATWMTLGASWIDGPTIQRLDGVEQRFERAEEVAAALGAIVDERSVVLTGVVMPPSARHAAAAVRGRGVEVLVVDESELLARTLVGVARPAVARPVALCTEWSSHWERLLIESKVPFARSGGFGPAPESPSTGPFAVSLDPEGGCA